MKNKNIKKLYEFFPVIIIISLMVGISELLGEKEIIFPEIAALSIGYFLSPSISWKISNIRMISTITICASLGVLIVLFIPLPLYLQLFFAFVIGQLVLYFSKTSFAPMISAICLPVLIQTKSIVYIISAFSLTLIIIIMRMLLERYGIKNKEPFVEENTPIKQFVPLLVLRSILSLVLIYFAIKVDYLFCVAPPLLVAYVELCNKKVNLKRRLNVIFIISAFALIGSTTRYLLCTKLGLPLILSAIIITIVITLVINISKLYVPPAGAMSVLALLIPESYILKYPLCVLIGIIVLALFSYLVSICLKEKSNGQIKS